MPLIKSISGIRGTIGGKVGENLTPIDVVLFTSAFTTFLFENRSKNHKLKVVVGRDARISGEIISKIVVATLQSAGIDVIDVGLSTTPTVEMAVILENADGVERFKITECKRRVYLGCRWEEIIKNY